MIDTKIDTYYVGRRDGAAAEREAIAKMAEEMAREYLLAGKGERAEALLELAARIRARGGE